MVTPPNCLVCHSPQTRLFPYRGFTYHRCPDCGLVTTLPYPTESQILAHYQAKFMRGNYQLLRQYAPDYLKVYQDMASRLAHYINYTHKSGAGNAKTTRAAGRRHLVAGSRARRFWYSEPEKIAKLTGAKLLDIGTFTGEFLEAASALGADVYGTELQVEAVKIAATKFPRRVTTANILSTRFPGKNYDLITLLGLIEHVVNPRELLTRVTQLLKPGGIIMIQTPNSGSLLAKTMGKYWPPYAPIEHIHLFSRASLTQLLNQLGFTQLHYQAHVKKLPVNYVYQNLANFGPEFHRLLKPFSPLITRSHLSLPVYGGEMIVLAQKP